MEEDLDEDVVLENSQLHQYLVDVGVSNIETETVKSSSPEFIFNDEKERTASLPFMASAFLDAIKTTFVYIFARLKDHLIFEAVNFQLCKDHSQTILDKLIHTGVLEDDDRNFLKNYVEDSHLPACDNTSLSSLGLLWRIVPVIGIISAYCFACFYSKTCPDHPFAFNMAAIILGSYLTILAAGCIAIRKKQVSMRWREDHIKHCLVDDEVLLKLLRKSLQFIQEVELVKRGFTLINSQIDFWKMDQGYGPCQQQCPHLRRILFLTARKCMLVCKRATVELLALHPLISEVDHASLYLANIPLDDYGPCLQESVDEDDEESMKRLLVLTDNFSITALKAMYQLFRLQQSEFLRRLALCFCTRAQTDTHVHDNFQLDETVLRVGKSIKSEAAKLQSSFEFHRSGLYRKERVKPRHLDPLKPTSCTAKLFVAIHSLELHLQAAAHRTHTFASELETFTESDRAVEEGMENKWRDELQAVMSELEACRGCWEEGQDWLKKMFKSSHEPKAITTKVGPCPSKQDQRDEQPPVLLDDVDPVIVDQVFEAYTDPDEADRSDMTWDPPLSVEEKERALKGRQEARRWLSELKLVISVRARERERREERALKWSTIPNPGGDNMDESLLVKERDSGPVSKLGCCGTVPPKYDTSYMGFNNHEGKNKNPKETSKQYGDVDAELGMHVNDSSETESLGANVNSSQLLWDESGVATTPPGICSCEDDQQMQKELKDNLVKFIGESSSFSASVAAMAAARSKEQLQFNVETFGDYGDSEEEETLPSG